MFKVRSFMSISIFPTESFIEYPMCSTARMEEITIYPLKKWNGGGCNNFFINSDFKTTQHRYKENKFLTFYHSTFWWLF